MSFVGRTLSGGIDWTRLTQRERKDNPARVYRILVADWVGLLADSAGRADASEFALHLSLRGATFHDHREASVEELRAAAAQVQTPGLHFFYQPGLAGEAEWLNLAGRSNELSNGLDNGSNLKQGDVAFDGLIAAATFVPADTYFSEGGVRIGAGTGNMGSLSWGGGDGAGGSAPLMNTPSFNSRATAQMLFKALLRIRPDLAVDELYSRVRAGTFDTAEHLGDFATRKLEGQRMGVLGFGNIGREVARLAQAFGMRVAVYARTSQQRWIESEGFEYCASVVDAAYAADVLTVHLGLGLAAADGFANAQIINAQVLSVLAPDAVLINYDRGELVDIDALDKALSSGHLAFAAIDADLFLGESQATGPLAPYLKLLDQHEKRLELLPHAAADTDHPSRCAGAMQAADQLIAAICYRCVANLKGDLPAGYTNLGSATLPGVGAVAASAVASVAQDTAALSALRQEAGALAQWLDELATLPTAQAGAPAQRGVEAANRLSVQLARLGLTGSARDL